MKGLFDAVPEGKLTYTEAWAIADTAQRMRELATRMEAEAAQLRRDADALMSPGSAAAHRAVRTRLRAAS